MTDFQAACDTCAPTEDRSADDGGSQSDLDFRRGVVFTGLLRAGSEKVAIRFRVTQLRSGALRFIFHRLRLTQKTAWIVRHWDRRGTYVAYFELEGRSETAVELRSERLYLTSLGRSTTAFATTLGLKGGCQTATLTRSVGDSGAAIVLALSGFEGFRTVTADTPLGQVTVGGVTPLPKDDRLSGQLHIAPPSGIDLVDWRPKADAFLRYIIQMLSFAGAGSVKAPLEETWADGVWTLEYREQSPPVRTGQDVIHPLDLQPFFIRATAAYFDPPIAVGRLDFAIDWFCMTASHTEVRLVAAMTALENLLDANLTVAERSILPAKGFEVAGKALRQTLRKALVDVVPLSVVESLYPKLADLNRRAFEEKLRLLCARWNVPLAGITAEEIAVAIKARNVVVHRGHFDADPPPSAEERDLWVHVILIRELVARIVLSALGFQGRYISFRGGYHFAKFPPALTQALS